MIHAPDAHVLTAKPSKFGHGSADVLDESVRKASELLPDKFNLTVGGKDVLTALEDVRRERSLGKGCLSQC